MNNTVITNENDKIINDYVKDFLKFAIPFSILCHLYMTIVEIGHRYTNDFVYLEGIIGFLNIIVGYKYLSIRKDKYPMIKEKRKALDMSDNKEWRKKKNKEYLIFLMIIIHIGICVPLQYYAKNLSTIWIVFVIDCIISMIVIYVYYNYYKDILGFMLNN